MSNPDAKISRWNTGYAGLVLGWGWLKTEKLLAFLNHIPLVLKTVKRSPRSKLEDLVLCLMTGVESLGQINSALRYDRGLTLAAGRESLADQSLLSQTLDAFNAGGLAKLRSNMVQVISERSRTLARIEQRRDTVLDLDMTDLPCSARCEGATKGRTTAKHGSTVRQLSLVYNHRFRESLDAFLHTGNTNCAVPLELIVTYLEDSYGWDRAARESIVWRLDSGYGSDKKLSWLMRRGYRVVAKGLSTKRAANWARALQPSDWKPVGATQDIHELPRIATITSPHRCLLVRTQQTKSEGYRYSYLVSNLKTWVRPKGHVLFYNQRQGIEKEVQQIKCVLGLKHKRKHSFIGMEALALLTLMANLELVWYRRALGLDELGIKRFIRDVIKSPGFVASGRSGLRVEVAPEAAYFNKLNDWKPQIDLPLYLSEIRGILYKN